MASTTTSPAMPYIDPADMPDLYAIAGHGRCMEPIYSDGQLLVADKREAPHRGDAVILHFTRQAAPHYGAPGWIKRLVRADGDGAIIIVEQLNPPQRYGIPATHIAAMHKCVGTATKQDDGRAAFRRPSGER